MGLLAASRCPGSCGSILSMAKLSASAIGSSTARTLMTRRTMRETRWIRLRDEDGDGDGEGGGDGDGDGNGNDSRPGQLLHRKFRLAQAYFEKLTDEEKEQLRDQQERDFEERREAFCKSLNGETECSPDELAERRGHTEVISQRTLETLCAQMKCKGLLILGEIVEGDDDEVFLSMVTSGSLAKHPGIHFAKWAPMRSKSMLQTFADFLVASKKDEKGLLGSLLDPGPPATAASTALCSQCLGGLTRLDSQPPPDTPSVASKARKTTRRRRKRAADSGAEEEEDGWRASGEDTEDQEDELESSTHATSHREGDEGECNEEEPCAELRRPPNSPMQRALNAMTRAARDYTIRDWNTLSDYEFDREKNIAKNRELLHALIPQGGTAAAMGLAGPAYAAGPEPENALPPEPMGTSPARPTSPEGAVANGTQAPPPSATPTPP
ncbi:hypothetical protein B0H14DRAFT_3502764 [Mycena olivaceomarginata]|nr:hypothetical protein B0H14DRAFT_3502764 [Mycena olivaceomarginata]